MATFKLSRTKQCALCPWKISTNPHEIPNGYCTIKHAELIETIAEPGEIRFDRKAMACHHSKPGNEQYCIGWLHNQLGAGNNIGLRLKMLNCENIGKIEIDGEQHKSFKDTLPK